MTCDAEETTVSDKYKDIIDLPHKQSAVRKHMSMRDRAAQFAPFSALTGYGDAIDETARRTEEKMCESEWDRDVGEDGERYT